MKEKLLGLVRFAVAEFGPLIVFWALAATSGVKVAIAGSILAILVDAAWRRWKQQPFTRLYLLVSALTLGFGCVDLSVTTPFMLAYEAPITNLATAGAFVVGAFGDKPILQEAAEQRMGALPATPAVARFFRLFTLIWAGYFVVKAIAYVWIATRLPLTEALALRSLIGSISLGAMIALSVAQGPRLFQLFRRLGWLGEAAGGIS